MVDRKVLALHTYYWTDVFQMNGFTLMKRYKKHLPAKQRRDVDALCDMIMTGAEPEQIETAVESILTAIWSADDWAAAIRDPQLAADEHLDTKQLAEWQRRLAG